MKLKASLNRRTAEAYALIFRSLADASRILVLNRLAEAERALSVAELVELVDVGQSTVSHHLRVLLDAGFVRVRYVGNASLFEVNEQCLQCFPATAAAILNQGSPVLDECATCPAIEDVLATANSEVGGDPATPGLDGVPLPQLSIEAIGDQ